ncbi:MAG: UDP-glucose 4-epimerase GalE [Dehalococcoidia bacterium]|nr:UDP-glucose 4-epimerase GalE [Dehalococcoidia bacterium]
MHVLVTGGAGYVGSVVADALLKAGHAVTVLDNLQQGHREAVPKEAQFIESDYCSSKDLDSAFRQSGFDAVMHMAAETIVEYSTTDPRRYFHTNVVGGINLLDTMLRHKVNRIVFSSSAAVYGEPLTAPIEEDHPKNPINSYGLTKLMFEQILQWYGRAYGLKHISLRYFNAAGATEHLGEQHNPETHLIPNVLRAALTGTPVSVFGTDYPTRDGSCIRDYVHVIDIARAHVLALQRVDDLKAGGYNLGNGQGYSVLEVIQAARDVTGIDIPVRLRPRREGDPAVLVASSSRARSELGWNPRYPKLEPIIESAWQWMRTHRTTFTGPI